MKTKQKQKPSQYHTEAQIERCYWSGHMIDCNSDSYRTAVTGFLIRRHRCEIIRRYPGKTLLSVRSIEQALLFLGATDVTPEGRRIVAEDSVYAAIAGPGWNLPWKAFKDGFNFDLAYIDATPSAKEDRTLLLAITTRLVTHA